jgi:hypothetical protein
MMERLAVEFTCVDCGIRVHAYALPGPDHHRCAQCQWLSEVEDENEREKLREWMKGNDKEEEQRWLNCPKGAATS